MPHSTTETEIKLAVGNAVEARRMLRAAGFVVHKRRVFEANAVYDTAEMGLRTTGRLLRLREAAQVYTLTYKGVATPARHKSREEQELVVPDAQVMKAILQGIGFQPMFRYEKYRTEFKLPGTRGIATIDETPIGVYMELEGAGTWIDRMARRLKFSELDYITASYGALYASWCRDQGVEPGNMVFKSKA